MGDSCYLYEAVLDTLVSPNSSAVESWKLAIRKTERHRASVIKVKQRYKFDIKQMTADCEANYLRICRLLPEIVELAEQARAEADTRSGQLHAALESRSLLVELSRSEEARLEINLQEQCRYTTTLQLELSYHGGGAFTRFLVGSKVGEGNTTEKIVANLLVRMYHDLRLAEVVAASGRRLGLASYEYPNDLMFQPDEKAQQNLFLAELLSQFVQHGFTEDMGQHLNIAQLFNP